MISRYEYKYLVPNNLVEKLRAELNPFMRLDDYAQKHSDRQYTVRSIYYDSPQFTCYNEKIDGVQIRNKYRIRGYDSRSNESIAFLEIKHKNGFEIFRSPRVTLSHLPAALGEASGDRGVLAPGPVVGHVQVDPGDQPVPGLAVELARRGAPSRSICTSSLVSRGTRAASGRW